MEFLGLFFYRFRIHRLIGSGTWLDMVLGRLAISSVLAYLQLCWSLVLTYHDCRFCLRWSVWPCLVTVRCLRYLWVLNLSHTLRHPYRNVQSGHIEDLTIGLRCVMVIGVGHREPISSWLQLFCEP